MDDLIVAAKAWLKEQGGRVQTHSDKCHHWHLPCLVARLVARIDTPSRRNDITARLRAEVCWEPEVGELLGEAADHIDSLRQEIRVQRMEIAGLREERRGLLQAERPMDGIL